VYLFKKKMQQSQEDNVVAGVVARLLGFQTAMKIHHWQTPTFAHHKASDELLDTMSGLLDKFTEALQGVLGRRVNFNNRKYYIPLQNSDNEQAVALVTDLRTWLIDSLPREISLTPGLVNIRDEIVSALDSTLYLFTFK
jgi:hypothetical protein